MPASIVTSDDLMDFKIDLLEGITELLHAQQAAVIRKTWLKSTQVMEMLQISPGTLHNFRLNGTLPYTRIGSIIFYDLEDIEKVLYDNRVNPMEK